MMAIGGVLELIGRVLELFIRGLIHWPAYSVIGKRGPARNGTRGYNLLIPIFISLLVDLTFFIFAILGHNRACKSFLDAQNAATYIPLHACQVIFEVMQGFCDIAICINFELLGVFFGLSYHVSCLFFGLPDKLLRARFSGTQESFAVHCPLGLFTRSR